MKSDFVYLLLTLHYFRKIKRLITFSSYASAGLANPARANPSSYCAVVSSGRNASPTIVSGNTVTIFNTLIVVTDSNVIRARTSRNTNGGAVRGVKDIQGVPFSQEYERSMAFFGECFNQTRLRVYTGQEGTLKFSTSWSEITTNTEGMGFLNI